MTDDIVLAGFDMDGTLLEQDSSWVAIHKHFGTTKFGTESLDLYTKGKIDYEEFMRRDIKAWGKGADLETIDRVLSGYRLRPEARPVVAALKEKGIESAIITSGIDILAEKVAGDLGIKTWVANGLRFDQSGKVLPDGNSRVDPTRKDIAYLKLLGRLGIPSSKTIAVGDTVYDLAFLRSAAKGFMLAHTTRVEDPRIIHIESLTEILDEV